MQMTIMTNEQAFEAALKAARECDGVATKEEARLQVTAYFEGRGQVMAYARGPVHALFVAEVFRGYLGEGWNVVIQPEGAEV